MSTYDCINGSTIVPHFLGMFYIGQGEFLEYGVGMKGGSREWGWGGGVLDNKLPSDMALRKISYKKKIFFCFFIHNA